MAIMDAELERALRGLENAAEFARHYRFEMTPDYVALIERVEALPRNQNGADKSGRWLGSGADARAFLARVVPPRR